MKQLLKRIWNWIHTPEPYWVAMQDFIPLLKETGYKGSWWKRKTKNGWE
jgi:hypothetical protein